MAEVVLRVRVRRKRSPPVGGFLFPLTLFALRTRHCVAQSSIRIINPTRKNTPTQGECIFSGAGAENRTPIT